MSVSKFSRFNPHSAARSVSTANSTSSRQCFSELNVCR